MNVNKIFGRPWKMGTCGSRLQRADRSYREKGVTVVAIVAILLLCTMIATPSKAEYGDVVINNQSDEAGMRPPVFPHWFHRIRFRCKVCHADLGFKFKAGGNQISMLKIIDGEFCGACHNGDIAWSVENCDVCHSGKPGMPTQVHGNTVQKLVGSPGKSKK